MALVDLLTEEPDGSKTWEVSGPRKFGILSVRFFQKDEEYFAELRAPKKKVSLDFGPLDEFEHVLIQVENMGYEVREQPSRRFGSINLFHRDVLQSLWPSTRGSSDSRVGPV